MMQQIKNIAEKVYYAFPVQLLINNGKNNQILLFCWLLLFLIITGNFGGILGVPYLFLDPEYMTRVGFSSFFIMGLSIAAFSTAFHIACYISEGHKFPFIGALGKPFTKFSLNNSFLPLVFLTTYIINIAIYQLNSEYSTIPALVKNITGLLFGFFSMTTLLFTYFWFTNKDVFKYMVCKLDEKLKQNIKVTRAGALRKLEAAKNKQKTRYFLDFNFKFRKTSYYIGFYDKETLIQVFDQNHFNLVLMELLVIVILLLLGIFKDYQAFQIPAAASFTLFLTVFVMVAGAFSYWFGKWSITAAIALFITMNVLMQNGWFTKQYQAYGLDYKQSAAPYSLSALRDMNSYAHYKTDTEKTRDILNNWKSKFDTDKKPKMVFICTSGGGQRSALWTLTALQTADSLTHGKLMKHTVLMTGASGGLIGAAYFRELILRWHQNLEENPYDHHHRKIVSKDNLNIIMFSLLANDLFVGLQKFHYGGFEYNKDRIYSFEQQMNKNTDFILDKPLSDYLSPEKESIIPMMMIAPTIANDGRKLFISPQPVSYMNSDIDSLSYHNNQKMAGVDFQHFFQDYGASQLRFLSALRMNATFPYITPTTSLPSTPKMQIMDAGISDNFGIADATRFMFVFREWIRANTSGIILLTIRDSEKNKPIAEERYRSLIERFSTPISNIYGNFENLQDITNNRFISYTENWFGKPVERVELEYNPEKGVRTKEILGEMGKERREEKRASLNWRLTAREKRSIINDIHRRSNQKSLRKLIDLLEEKRLAKQ